MVIFYSLNSFQEEVTLSKLNYELYICEVYYNLLGIYMTQLISSGLSARLETISENWNSRIFIQQVCTIFPAIKAYFKKWSSMLFIISDYLNNAKWKAKMDPL